MLSRLSASEVAAALIVIALVGALIFVWARRRSIVGGYGPTMPCARRDPRTGRWRLGLARLGHSRFEWFSVVGPSFSPELAWVRHDIELAPAVPLAEPIPGIVDPVLVAGSCGGQSMDFAVPRSSYTAVRAWLESSPPGVNVNVA